MTDGHTTVEDLIEFAGLRDIAEEVGIVDPAQQEISAPRTSTPSAASNEGSTTPVNG